MDPLFSNTLNPFEHEIHQLIRLLLMSRDSQKRSEVLKSLRKSLKKSHNVLPQLCHEELFDAVLQVLKEEKKPSIVCECLWLIVDVIPSVGHSLDRLLAPILSEVVPLLGHESADVRRASLRLVHVQMRHTLNLQKSLKTLIHYGLESRDPQVQKGTVVALPLLIGEEFQNENLFLLVDALCSSLVRADNALFYPLFLALQRLNSVLGNSVFHQYLSRVSEKEAKELYESVLSRNNSADENEIERQINARSIGQPISYLETTSPRKTPHVSFQESQQHVITQQQRQESEESDNYDNNYDPLLRYGLFPSGLIWHAINGSNEEKMAAIESMVTIVRETETKRLINILPEMKRFLEEFIGNNLLEQNSFKVTLSSLDIIEILVERLKTSMTPFLQQIVSVLAKRLGDGRTVVRDSVIKVIHNLCFTFPPQEVLDCLLVQKPAKSPKIREELVNRVSAAVLTFPSLEFNFPKLAFSVVPLLADNRRSVRLAALECCAVLAQALTPSRLSPLLAAVEAVELNCDCEGLTRAVQTRINRRQLPKVSSDGTIRYFLSTNGWLNNWPHDQPDLEWVMMATPSSHNGTPPKTLPLHRKPSNGFFHSNIPVGLYPER